ncbi:MAG: ATP-binding protein [Bacteroidia bacterium]|nr:ATP-binding protein [Bacteroidia bacterium]
MCQPDKDEILQPFTITNNDFVTDNDIYKATEIQHQYYILNSFKKGALLIDKSGKALQQYQAGNHLQTNTVYRATADASQNIWLCLSNGISKTEPGQDLSYWDKNAGLNGNVVSVIRYNGTVYIATGTKIYFIDRNNKIQEVKNIPVSQNWCFLENKNSKSLLAGSSLGVYEIKGDDAVNLYQGSHAHQIYQSVKNPQRIYSTDFDLFVSLKYENNKWATEGKWEGVKDDVRGITEDDKGEIWLSTFSNGIIRVTPDNENITKPLKVKYYNKKDGIKSLFNILPFKFKNKIIWGTPEGIITYDSKTDRFEPFCEFGEQFCNDSLTGVHYMSEGTDGKIWIFKTGKREPGIGYLQPDNKGGYNWIYAPFCRIPSMLLLAFYIEPSGVAWFGGSEGLYRYDINKDTKNYTQKFNCLIRKITIGPDSMLYGGNASVLPDFKNESNLKYKYNSLKFEFAAPFFDHEELTLYSYQLEGFDENWSAWSRQTAKEYTNLSEGTYTFKVKARNIYDVESEIGAYQIKILPPWQRTWYAFILYLILFILLIYLIIKFYTRRLVKQKEHLEEVVKERTAVVILQKEEIFEQAEQLKATNEKLVELDQFKEGMTGMIVHDLKNPLNAMLGVTNNDETKQAAKQMLNMVLNILDVQKLEDAQMKIQSVDFPLNSCLLDALQQVSLLYERKSIFIDNLISNDIVVKGDIEIIQRVFINLLTNAIKYTPNNGKISIAAKTQTAFESLSGFIQVEVSDTGQGIPKDKLNSVFDKFVQVEAKNSGGVRSTGLGLTFCKLAVEEHGGQIGVESEMNIGTTFWFSLPKSEIEISTFDQLNKSGNENLPEKVQFNEEEKKYLLPIINKLSQFSVYEFSDVRKILQKMDSLDNPRIETWKNSVMNAMKACNEEKYIELLTI